MINPVAGAAVAMKALLPSLGLTLSKFGLRYVGDSAEARDVTKQIKSAEKEVLQQFKESGTTSFVNPLLQQLDRALATTESEFDPVLEFDRESLDFPSVDRDRFFRLTCRAITNVYEDVLKHPEQWADWNLGPEDIRFLKLVRDLARNEKRS